MKVSFLWFLEDYLIQRDSLHLNLIKNALWTLFFFLFIVFLKILSFNKSSLLYVQFINANLIEYF